MSVLKSSLNGLPTIELIVKSMDGASSSKVLIYLFGATIASYVKNSNEYLFMSPNAVFNGIKALRGGVPVVFPQFGQPNLAMSQHGILRTSLNWKLSSSTVAADDNVVAVLVSESTDETKVLWPYDFRAELKIHLTTSEFKYALTVINTGSIPFSCHTLLHTYIRISSITDARIRGFQGLKYIDKLVSSTDTFVENSNDIEITSETDRIYIDESSIPDVIILSSGKEYLRTCKKAIMISPSGEVESIPCDVVLWNPWIAKSSALVDLGVESYPEFVCIEPGTIFKFVEVLPGSSLSLEQVLSPF
jgi:glucose-6-phosphate 1-epimerase